MSAAAYNRGSRVVSRDAVERVPHAIARNERAAIKDEASRLRAEVATLKRELARARRCLAACRYAHEEWMRESRADAARSDAAISTLCRIAFPADRLAKGADDGE